MPGILAAACWHCQSQPSQVALCKCVNLGYTLQRLLGCDSVPAAPHGSPRDMELTARWVRQFPRFLRSGVRGWQLELRRLFLLQSNLCLIFIQNLNKFNFEILKPSENEMTALCWAPAWSLTCRVSIQLWLRSPNCQQVDTSYSFQFWIRWFAKV